MDPSLCLLVCDLEQVTSPFRALGLSSVIGNDKMATSYGFVGIKLGSCFGEVLGTAPGTQ